MVSPTWPRMIGPGMPVFGPISSLPGSGLPQPGVKARYPIAQKLVWSGVKVFPVIPSTPVGMTLWKNESAWNQYSRNWPPRGNSKTAGWLAVPGAAAAATPVGRARVPSDAAPTAAPFRRFRLVIPPASESEADRGEDCPGEPVASDGSGDD